MGSLLGIISGAVVTLASLVFSALTAAMSLSVTALSVRISPVFSADRVIQWGLGCFVGTFAHALLIALSMAVGGDAYRPWASTVAAVAITVGCGVMFITVAVRVCRLLNPGALLRHLAAEGRDSTRYEPARFHTRAAELATGTATGTGGPSPAPRARIGAGVRRSALARQRALRRDPRHGRHRAQGALARGQRSRPRSWADYVAAATDEIRQYGTGSVQIQRRLRELFDTLAGQCELQQRAALLERRAALQRGLERWWPDLLDRRLAGCADPQGLGRALGTAACAEQAPEPEAPLA
ncbi:hypothetical protein GCM10009690_00840 [Brevibacterium permense]|uniref:Uncharacterized protein n=1 Tax=Brevibacterium permense TaxID=234834 RepID=A0ABN1ZQV8_9MICO